MRIDAQLASITKNLWQGRDLPFPVALTTTRTENFVPGKSGRSKAADQYGISSYPTTILIDREGKLVGVFADLTEEEEMVEIEKRLGLRQ